ncbi:MAG: flagellar basal body L-ring protein FlgH [Pseudomonadales bacterium]|nr:flagellar basal body L-ring protein FlgH [Pseudomonadales bacterium]
MASLVIILSGCMNQPSRPEPKYEPTYPKVHYPPSAEAGALYQDGFALSLFSDRGARRVGDIVTIILEEQTKSTKSSETSLKKESESKMQEPILFGNLLRGLSKNAGLANSVDSEHDFKGAADSDQSNSLSGTITAVISKVLPNGLMLVQGEKWLNLNQGEEYIRISGLLRPEDVDGTNAVSSLRLADARIAYSGTGSLADSNKVGWLTRFFIGPLMPF